MLSFRLCLILSFSIFCVDALLCYKSDLNETTSIPTGHVTPNFDCETEFPGTKFCLRSITELSWITLEMQGCMNPDPARDMCSHEVSDPKDPTFTIGPIGEGCLSYEMGGMRATACCCKEDNCNVMEVTLPPTKTGTTTLATKATVAHKTEKTAPSSGLHCYHTLDHLQPTERVVRNYDCSLLGDNIEYCISMEMDGTVTRGCGEQNKDNFCTNEVALTDTDTIGPLGESCVTVPLATFCCCKGDNCNAPKETKKPLHCYFATVPDFDCSLLGDSIEYCFSITEMDGVAIQGCAEEDNHNFCTREIFVSDTDTVGPLGESCITTGGATYCCCKGDNCNGPKETKKALHCYQLMVDYSTVPDFDCSMVDANIEYCLSMEVVGGTVTRACARHGKENFCTRGVRIAGETDTIGPLGESCMTTPSATYCCCKSDNCNSPKETKKALHCYHTFLQPTERMVPNYDCSLLGDNIEYCISLEMDGKVRRGCAVHSNDNFCTGEFVVTDTHTVGPLGESCTTTEYDATFCCCKGDNCNAPKETKAETTPSAAVTVPYKSMMIVIGWVISAMLL